MSTARVPWLRVVGLVAVTAAAVAGCAWLDPDTGNGPGAGAVDVSDDSGPHGGPDRTDHGVELTARPIGLTGSCAAEHGADLLATVDPDAVVLARFVETEPRPDAPPALRTEVRADGTVTSWDSGAQQYDQLTVPLHRLVDLLDQSWSTGCGIEGTHVAFPEVTHVVETIRVLGPDGTLHDIVWDTDPPSRVAGLAELVAPAVSDADTVECPTGADCTD